MIPGQEKTVGDQRGSSSARGMTLIELVVVLSILGVIAGLLFLRGDAIVNDGKEKATLASMASIRDSSLGTPEFPGFADDLGELPLQIADLVVQPPILPSGKPCVGYDLRARQGWNGPYLRGAMGQYQIDSQNGFLMEYGNDGAPAILDPWGHPIVLQRPTVPGVAASILEGAVRLVSAGDNGRIDTPIDVLRPQPEDDTVVGDDIVLYLRSEAGQ